jgi:hypothetical protein
MRAGLVERAKRRGAHRRKRERKPCEGMMLHQDGSRHGWLAGQAPLDLIVTMDDATSTVYSAFLMEEEGTASTLRGLLEVLVTHGLPCSLYTDRASHYFYTGEAGEAVDKDRLTQVGRAQRVHVSRATAARALRDISERGFVEVVRQGGFSCKRKLATEWRLTMYYCDVSGQVPSKAFTRWDNGRIHFTASLRSHHGAS